MYTRLLVAFVLWLSGWNVLIAEHKKRKAIPLNELTLKSSSSRKKGSADSIRSEKEILFRIDKENLVPEYGACECACVVSSIFSLVELI